jgi:hypothetical protein
MLFTVMGDISMSMCLSLVATRYGKRRHGAECPRGRHTCTTCTRAVLASIDVAQVADQWLPLQIHNVSWCEEHARVPTSVTDYECAVRARGA